MLRFAILFVVSATATQAQIKPDPHCSFLAMMQVVQHHFRCSPKNEALRGELQASLQMYAEYFVRNSDATANDMETAIRLSTNDPLPDDYDCTEGAVAHFHDELAADLPGAVRTAQLHLEHDRWLDLDFDKHCFGDAR